MENEKAELDVLKKATYYLDKATCELSICDSITPEERLFIENVLEKLENKKIELEIEVENTKTEIDYLDLLEEELKKIEIEEV